MKNLLPKFSLYDFLTTIVLGGVIFCGIYINPWHPDLFKGHICLFKVNTWVIAWACYVLGIWLHKVAECIDASLCVSPSGEVHPTCKLWEMVESFLCRNHPATILRAQKDVSSIWLENPLEKIPVRKDLLKMYYTAYYDNIKNCPNVGKLEAHSALLKDILVSSIIFLPWLIDENCCCLWIIFSLFVIFTSWARYYCEYKISYSIWERDAYEKRRVIIILAPSHPTIKNHKS